METGVLTQSIIIFSGYYFMLLLAQVNHSRLRQLPDDMSIIDNKQLRLLDSRYASTHHDCLCHLQS
jgi:hypothetical protein